MTLKTSTLLRVLFVPGFGLPTCIAHLRFRCCHPLLLLADHGHRVKFAFHLALGKSTLLFGCELNGECLREVKMPRQVCVVGIEFAIRDRIFVIMYASSWLRRGAIPSTQKLDG